MTHTKWCIVQPYEKHKSIDEPPGQQMTLAEIKARKYVANYLNNREEQMSKGFKPPGITICDAVCALWTQNTYDGFDILEMSEYNNINEATKFEFEGLKIMQ